MFTDEWARLQRELSVFSAPSVVKINRVVPAEDGSGRQEDRKGSAPEFSCFPAFQIKNEAGSGSSLGVFRKSHGAFRSGGIALGDGDAVF